MREALEILRQGGVVMYPLGIASVVTIAIAIERAYRFWRADTDGDAALSDVLGLIKGGGSGAEAIVKQDPSPVAAVISAGLTNRGRGRQEIEESLMAAVADERLRLSKNLGILGTIGNVAPFIGLFGTVLGIMKAFRDIGEVGAAGPAVVATGIAEALVATAAGLFVAVIAVIAFNFFTIWLDRISQRAEIVSAKLINELVGEQDASK